MKNLEKHAVTIGLVAAGVVVAGYALNAFKSNTYINDARKGFGGI